MRVLQINSVCGIGSTGRIATDIHKELLNQGHESYIAYGRGEAKNIDINNTIKIGNKFDQALHLIRTRLFDSHGLGSKRATKKFIKQIEKLNPEVIHLHNIHGYYINYPILFNFLKKYKGKIIWTLHDTWTFTGHSAGFSYPLVEGWYENAIHRCGGKKNYPRSFILDRRVRNGKLKVNSFSNIKNMTIVTPSKWLASFVNESYLNQYKIEVINNGINTNVFSFRKSDFKQKYFLEEKKIILGVSNPWTEKKGLNTFIELSKIIDNNYIIVLVGLNKKQLKKIPSNIIGIEKTNSTVELIEIYSAADVFFNPTLEDNYPTVNLEAQSCGTPVITFDTGGSPESAAAGNFKVIKNINFFNSSEFEIFINKENKIVKDISIEIFIKKLFVLYGSVS